MGSERKRYELTAREQKHAFLGLYLPYFVFELTEPVQPELLCQAARQAVGLHPLFGTSLVRDGVFYFEEDPCWEQHPEGTVIAGGNGRRLWEISCTGTRVILTASHALADGMGFLQFAATLFHLYFQLCGTSFSEAANSDLPADPAETARHPREICPPMTDGFVGVPRFPAPSPLPADCFSLKGGHALHLVEIPEREIRRFATQSETSVFAVIACLLARTAEEAFRLNDGCIFIRVPVDCRKAFGTCTDRNLSQGFSLCYRPEKMARLPDEFVETAFRSQLDLFTDRDNMIHSLQKDFRRMQELKEGKVSLDSYRQLAEDASSPQAVIHYSHLTRPCFSDELSAKFNRLYMISDSPVAHSLQTGAITFKGQISLALNQHVVGRRFTDALEHALEKKGIAYTLREIRAEEILGKTIVPALYR